MLNWQDVGFSLNTLILIFIECILPPAHADTLEQYNLYQDRYIHCIHTYIPHIYGHKQSLSIYLGHTIKIKKIVGPKSLLDLYFMYSSGLKNFQPQVFPLSVSKPHLDKASLIRHVLFVTVLVSKHP